MRNTNDKRALYESIMRRVVEQAGENENSNLSSQWDNDNMMVEDIIECLDSESDIFDLFIDTLINMYGNEGYDIYHRVISELHDTVVKGDEQTDLDYWKVDFIDEYNEGYGFSICVCCPSNDYKEDEIVDACVSKGIVDADDVYNFIVNVEDISDDQQELSHWKQQAQML